MLSHLLETIADALDERGIPYMIIGGQAVLLHGEPRMTKDIDVTLGVSADSLDVILCVASSLGWEVMVEMPESFVKRTMVLPCRDPQSGFRIDLIFSFSPYERAAISHALHIRVGETLVRFATVEDLVIHKLVAGRPRDIEDARLVLAKNPGIDDSYVRSWLEQFGTALKTDFIQQFEELFDSPGG